MTQQNFLEKWKAFGPIDNPGREYPGKLGWDALAGDALAEIPESITVNGERLEPVSATMAGDTLDFRKVFKIYPSGSPECYAFCEFTLDEPLNIVLSVDAEWGAVVWLDGKEIIDMRNGNSFPVGSYGSRKTLKLELGHHVLCCRHISGWGGSGWLLRVKADMVSAEAGSRGSYLDSGLRLEERPLPTGMIANMTTEAFEKTAATVGVESRWISVFDQSELRVTGDALYKSEYLPVGENYDPQFESNLKEWVKIIHDQGLPVVSWAAMCHCHQGWVENSEWRQVFLVKPGPDDTHVGMNVCVNTGYGDAFIKFCIEAIEKFDLDGFWFDGAAFSSVWCAPFPVSCLCESCKAKYREDTGKEIPTEYKPETREFREWMLWRYHTFSQYWQHLAREIKAVHPTTTLAVNHYHRETIPWNGGVPLNPFDADIVSATEADCDPWKAAFYTRINRAYGRPHSETWISSNIGTYTMDGVKKHNPYPLITQAVSCLTAGADSSFGGVDLSVSAAVYSELSAEIRPRKPYRYLPSYLLVAMHVSQQTDTFSFGTMPEFILPQWKDHYWKSLVGWHRLMMTAGLWMDVVFDDHLTKDYLAQYPYLFMPLATALSETQIDTLLDYVNNGGTLLTGPWFAVQDEWGFARERNAQLQFLLPCGETLPEYAAFPACLIEKQSDPVSVHELGKGRLIQFPTDLGTIFREDPAPRAVETIQKFLGREKGNIPICLEGPDGQPAFAHIGVSTDKDNSLIVAIQQLEPFWDSSSGTNNRPPVAHNCRLRVQLPEVTAADCLIPESFPLEVQNKGSHKEIPLPPYTWGTTIRLWR